MGVAPIQGDEAEHFVTLLHERKNTLSRALALAYRNTVDSKFKLELDTWLTELGIEER
jgi:hypothetical protein